MSEPTDPDVPEVGWRVLDPDGNVVDSGPGMFLIAVGESGPEPDETEED
jgi:hypothetical protein